MGHTSASGLPNEGGPLVQTDFSESDTTSTLTSSSGSSDSENGADEPAIAEEVKASAPAGPPLLPPEIAILKLEQKFKDSMSKCADLSFEKERLEHVVVQLQEETDTVGEYITIYQYQRQQQKLRHQEKEAELEALNRDRADLRGQLARLEGMVRNFVAKEAGIHASTTPAHYINGGASDPGVEQSDKSSAVSSQV